MIQSENLLRISMLSGIGTPVAVFRSIMTTLVTLLCLCIHNAHIKFSLKHIYATKSLVA